MNSEVKSEVKVQTITITIKHLTAKDFKVTISKTSSILEVKEAILKLTEIPLEN